MSNAYQAMSTADLLHALETADRLPSVNLLRACLEHRAEMTPTLLEWLALGDDPDWDDDDPRIYRQIHAGHLLLHYREPQAIPVFMNRLRAQINETILEWFETELASFGLPILEPALELLADENASDWGRIAASEILTTLAKKFPDERARILAATYQILPALDGSNNLILPPNMDDEPPDLWSFLATNLAKLHDLDSRPLIKQLYQAELIDERVMGNYDDYLKYVTGKEKLPEHTQEFDILIKYEQMHQEQQRIAEMRASGTPSGKDLIKFLQGSPALPDPLQPLAPQVPFLRAGPKIGRNDPCHCGSGRKYKHCHGKN